MENNNEETTIEIRQKREKESLLAELKKLPVIHLACERAGIGRATYYRWRKEDKEFALKADEAFREGELFINDMSETQIIAQIRKGNFSAMTFWLRHHHPKYAPKLEIAARPIEKLDPEQEEIIKEALRLTSFENYEEG